MYLHPNVRDQGLQYLIDNATRMDICSQEPTTYEEATSTYSLGNWTAVVMSGPTTTSGDARKATVPTQTAAGVQTNAGTGLFYALTDGASLLLVVNALNGGVSFTGSGNWSSTTFDITMPAEVSA